MTKYILTKNFLELNETYGVIQNLSGDSNIEITHDTNEQGILLKPFQILNINRNVYARKINGAGTAQLVILPFAAQEINDEDYLDENLTDTGNSTVAEDYDNPYADFENEFFQKKSRGRPHCQQPPHYSLLPPFSFEPNKPLSVNETPTHYLVGISKDSLHGAKKFLIQFDESKG